MPMLMLMPMYMAQDRHPRGVLIGDLASKVQWIFDQRLR